MRIVRKTLNKCITLLPRPHVVDRTTYPCQRSVRLQLADPWIPRNPWTPKCGCDPQRYGRACIMAMRFVLDDVAPAIR